VITGQELSMSCSCSSYRPAAGCAGIPCRVPAMGRWKAMPNVVGCHRIMPSAVPY